MASGAFQGLGQKRADETRAAGLERKIGQQIDFLKRALQPQERAAVAADGGPTRGVSAGRQ